MRQRFWHYTCKHSIDLITRDRGTLRPNAGPGIQRKAAERARKLGLGDLKIFAFPVVWVSDVDVNTQDDAKLMGLGYRTEITDCFRIEFRFIVPNVGLYPWAEWADAHLSPEEQEYRALMETAEGCDPKRWWVSDKPLAGCRLDTNYYAVYQKGV